MSPELERLLHDEGWVRALARRLVRDRSAADDLVQEAWLAARRAPPRERSQAGLRRWTAAVLRNRVRQEARAGTRREGRERERARAEAVEGPSELLERLELRERVVHAVRELEEPYRTAVLLRWFEGLPPREIARRRGVSARTVHGWLARGLELLRIRLRRDFGSESGGWVAALAPLLEAPLVPLVPSAVSPASPVSAGTASAAGALGTSPVWIGALAMTVKLKLAALGVVAAGLAATYFAAVDRGEPVDVDAARVLAAPERAAPALEPPLESARVAPAAGEAREALEAAPEREIAASGATRESPAVLSGYVVDVDDRPLSGVALALLEDGGQRLVECTSASDGSFSIEAHPGASRLAIEDLHWAPILTPMFLHHTRGLVIVAAPRVDVSGVVVDPGQQPAAGATVRVHYDDTLLRARSSRVLDHAKLVENETTTDAAGRFTLERVPSSALGRLHVEHSGYESIQTGIPEASMFDLWLELPPRDPDGLRTLAGRVLDEGRAPVEGAFVRLDGSGAVSRDDGSFVLEIDDEHEPDDTGVLWAVAAGLAPARLARQGTSNFDPRAWPEPLELIVAGSAATLRGRVLDASGEAVAGARLFLLDPTPFGAVPVEGLGLELLADVESLLAGGPFKERVATDAAGRFVLEGLLEREYSVEAIDPKSLAHAALAVTPGAGEVEIRLPEVAAPRRLAGRVSHPDGSPASGARLVVAARRPDDLQGPSWIEGQETRAAADGPFEFPEASAAATHLWVAGDRPGGGKYVPIAGEDPERLEIVLARSCHVQITLIDPDEATAVRFLDAEGAELEAVRHWGNLAFADPDVELVDGRSQAVIVSELASQVALWSEGEELRRVPIELVPGELTIVRP